VEVIVVVVAAAAGEAVVGCAHKSTKSRTFWMDFHIDDGLMIVLR
jgi:hypothetical protein